MSVLIVALFVVVGVWIFALADLIRAEDMEPTGRLILAGALIFVAPIGLVLWLVVRAGSAGLVTAAGLIAVAAVVVGVGLTENSARPQVQSVQSISGSGMSLPVPVLPSP